MTKQQVQPLLQLATLKFDKLSLFTLLWAVASLFHILSFTYRLTLSNPLLWMTLFATAALIIFPGSVYLFMVMLLFRIADYVFWMPFTPNHLLFEFVVNISMLCALVYRVVAFNTRAQHSAVNFTDIPFRDSIYDFMRPAVTVSLIVLYFYAVIHKLNFDFLNPVISCSTFLMGHFSREIPSINDNDFIRQAAIWGTLLFEGGIPVLLCFKRTRAAGIWIGLLFHLLLSFHPHRGIYSFSALIFSLYFLFASENFIKNFYLAGQKFFGKHWSNVVHSSTYIRIFFALAVLVLVLVFNNPWKTFKAGFLLWLLWAMFVIAVYAMVRMYSTSNVKESGKLFKMPLKFLWLFPAIVFMNGLSPYLGFKTQTSFSMFSNLRTEGDSTNHVFVPASLQLGSFQNDLVDIISSDAEELLKFAEHSQLITFFEFRRITSGLQKDFFVEYRRNGEPQLLQVTAGNSNQPELLSPHPWLLSKVLAFRPVDKGPCLCKH